MTTTLLVVDTETGGLEPSGACIISIAAQVLVLGEGLLEPGAIFDTKIKPDRPVSKEAANVNGYTPEAWAGAPDGALALDLFRQWVEGVCKAHFLAPMWCGCNPLFDLKFYNSDRMRHGLIAPDGLSYRVIDVQSMAIPLLFRGEVSSVSLAALRAWAGLTGEQTHTAMGDVLDTCEVIGALLLRGAS
jgi:DNA polymerase III epsilon subunit-like protein